MRHDPRIQSGLSLQTLLIAGASSAAAAFVIPMLWEPGTVFAAATTPVIVALVSEGLKRPAATVQSVRSRRAPAARPDEEFDPLAPPPPGDIDALSQTTSRRTVQTTRRRGLTRRQWTIALVTGALAFAGAVLFVTVSELIAGERVGGKENATTFFGRDGGGGATGEKDDEKDARREATREPAASPTVTPEATTPEATATPAPMQTPTATATPTPSATSPAPLEAPAASPTPSP